MRILILAVAILMSVDTISAQTSIINIDTEINLPKDSIDSQNLLLSLNDFFIAAQKDAKNNDLIYQPHYLQTTVLLDEIEGINHNEKAEDDSFYQPYLMDISPIEDGQYFIQISYIGIEGKTPVTRANFELIAHKSEGKFLFSSPLVRNTKGWKTTTIENYTFHYEGTINLNKTNDYIKQRAFHDKKLNIAAKDITFYLFEDGLASQHYFGLPYKLDYNGEGAGMRWTVLLDDQEIYVINKSALFEFDPHDLWHNRLNQVQSRRTMNHAVDEAIATLYGGSYGWTWEELFTAFQDSIQFDKNTDWLQLRKDRVAFVTGGHRNPTDFMVNALFVQKIQAEKGFSAVWKLLSAKKEEAYFITLKEVMGITKNNYNKEVWKLVKKEMEDQKSRSALKDKANG